MSQESRLIEVRVSAQHSQSRSSVDSLRCLGACCLGGDGVTQYQGLGTGYMLTSYA